MPIAPMTFDKAFALLGMDVVTGGHCCWENYSRYNKALEAIQTAIRDQAGGPTPG